MTSQTITAVILAAGKSRRMKTPKPLLHLGEKPALDIVVTLFRRSGISDIRVVTGHKGEKIRHALPSLNVTWIQNDRYSQGMLSSVKRGVETIPPGKSGFFLLPADIPLVRHKTISTLIKTWATIDKTKTSVLHPTFMEKQGHPPLISTRHVPDILAWQKPGGLQAFLEGRSSNAMNVPVIDEYILKDMDTPRDYENLIAVQQRYNMPSPAECSVMLEDDAFFSEHTAAHCMAVARLAKFLGRRLASEIADIDPERIYAAALLHDVAKGRPDHAQAGADLLTELGFPAIADIVASHMDIDIKNDASLTDREVVYLADKLVMGDKPVPLSVRFDDKLARHGHDPGVRDVILKRKTDTLSIVRRVEKLIGTSLQDILNEYARKNQ